MAKLNILPYAPEWAERWDRFVMEESQNGTFLQTRRFLSYHPEGRFEDASLVVTLENGQIVAVLPGARCEAEGKLWFRSHPGSTFGGPILSRQLTQADKVIELLTAVEEVLTRTFRGCELKITPALFAPQPTALLEYALFYLGYRQDTELAAYVPLTGQTEASLRARYSPTKRYELKRCETLGLTARRLQTEEEIAAFYEVLTLNLRKFNAQPVHTLAELTDFLNQRLREETLLLGVYDPAGALVAGALLFYFVRTNTLHTQYLATDTRIAGYAPSAFLYHSVLRVALEVEADALSFGTSTFEHGHVLNKGLIQNKEGFGCLHSLNRLYSKSFLDR